MPSLLDILGYAGNVLDLPGSSLRDLLSGNNPFDQWATPFSSDNRASGRDVLQPFLGVNEETGMSGWLDNPMEGVKDLAGFGFEMAADPLNFVSMAPVFRALKGRKAAKTANKAERAASKGRYGFVNPKLLADDYVRPAAPATVVNPLDRTNQIKALQDEADSLVMASGAYDADGWGTGWIADEISSAQTGGLSDPTLQSLERSGLRGDYESLLRQIETLQTPEPLRIPRYTPNRVENPMATEQKLLGYTPAPEDPRFPGREVVHHGGHYWGDSATPQHPYGMMDLDRIHTGEGNTVKGPGGYVADDVRTTDRYYDMVANKAPEPDRESIRNLYARLQQEFAPGKDIMLGSGQQIDDVIEQADALSDDIFAIGADGTNYQRSRYPVVGIRPVGWEGNSLTYDLLHSTPDGIATVRDNSYDFGFSENDWSEYFTGLPIPMAETKPTRYTLDAPAGTKARMMNWEGGFTDQPAAVQDLVQNLPANKVLEELDNLDQEASMIRKQMDVVKKQYGINSFKATPNDPAELLQLRDKLHEAMLRAEVKKEEAISIFGSEYEFWKHSNGASTGEKMADMLMGKHPSQAKFEDVTGLLNAGVPGMKNLATSTGKTSYNYAIWDKDLWSQMRVRAIDEQPVPINPMFSPVKAEQRVIPQIAEPSLLETTNPMSLQPLPGLAKPAMQGAAYQALARFNSYGGSL